MGIVEGTYAGIRKQELSQNPYSCLLRSRIDLLDTLDIVAHDHYREIIDDVKNNAIFQQRNLDEEE